MNELHLIKSTNQNSNPIGHQLNIENYDKIDIKKFNL